jgi:hypothetical protein
LQTNTCYVYNCAGDKTGAKGEKKMEIEIDVCGLKAPAKCSRANILHEVPFAVGQECRKCEYKRIANVVQTVPEKDVQPARAA